MQLCVKPKQAIRILICAVIGTAVAELAAAPIFTYAQSVSSTQDVSFSVTITGTPTPTPSAVPPLGGGGTALPPAGETAVVLQGRAYPSVLVTALRNGAVASSKAALSDGSFEFKMSGLQPGIYTFGVYAVDAKGRTSLTLSFTINVIGGLTTTVSGILIPPTITANRDVFFPGETLELDGFAYGEGEVHVVLNSSHEIVESVPAESDGAWLLSFPVERLGLGDHASRAKARSVFGDQSTFSETRLFRIVQRGVPGVDASPAPAATPLCRGADLNFDGKVNLTDFSVMLFWWQTRNPVHPCVDINKDGIVNLRDFSMMMYQWKL